MKMAKVGVANILEVFAKVVIIIISTPKGGGIIRLFVIHTTSKAYKRRSHSSERRYDTKHHWILYPTVAPFRHNFFPCILGGM